MRIIVDKVYPSPIGAVCEKNWIAFNDSQLIYSWFPIQIYSYPDLKFIKKIDSPKLFNYFRGSSTPVKYKGLNWIVTHSVIYETPRTYLHYLVALDDFCNPVFYSLPFSFEGEKIEYCLGFKIESDIATFYYSTWDSCSKKISISLSAFKDSLILA